LVKPECRAPRRQHLVGPQKAAHLHFQPSRMAEIVGVLERYKLTSRNRQACVPRRIRALIIRQLNNSDPRIHFPALAEQRTELVEGSVINDDDLKILPCLTKQATN